ncbi:hypothetical protein J1P26_17395 [Neobacillus sp. MM2021_6]|uniref:hypothetical protein n=1 Tax=Bacillaceae TaxID=186817 RepID=UPI00140D613E|nr:MULTISPECIES: hypothetical protein [Bacillaceae]MBO0961484.1 hypothetical protein [Neobacillus sp. MM2021_6]NHC19588.1 hypothetical protein [Bacillus sp. MM2020_4]
MLESWKSSLPQLSYADLLNLVEDAERRIGSYVAGGNPINEYVQRQQALLELIQEELERR